MNNVSDWTDSSLLCVEESQSIFGGLRGDGDTAIDECSQSWDQENLAPVRKRPKFNYKETQPVVRLTMLNADCLTLMFEKEKDFSPKDDYLNRLRIGDFELSARKDALDWIWKAHAHFNYGPVCICLSVNYFDRFLSEYDIPRGLSWTFQLLAVTCLSLAAKIEEIEVPHCEDLQVGNPKFIFEGITIQRMELFVLGTLKWRMQAITPCSFIDYFLSKISDGNMKLLLSRSVQLILSTIKGIDFLEFKPSEIAAAVSISASREIQASLDIDLAMSSLIHVEKGRVSKCLELMKDLSLTNGSSSSPQSSLAQSPAGVLDDAAAAACMSSTSNDVTDSSLS